MERKQRRRKLKAIFNFLSWRKLKNLLQLHPRNHTHTRIHIVFTHTHTRTTDFVCRYLAESKNQIPRSKQKLRNRRKLAKQLFIAHGCCNY